MMLLTLVYCLITASCWSCDDSDPTVKTDSTKQELPQGPDLNFHIYVCFGQSNMEGSAKIEAMDKEMNRRLQAMQPMNCPNLSRKEGVWYTAEPPLSQCHAGLSPADYFGRTMIQNLPDSIRVGLIVVAVGGCDIRLFDKEKYANHTNTYPEEWFQQKITGYGGNPYQRIIDLASAAQKDGVIKGFLLHQGETNTGDTAWPGYVTRVYDQMIADLELNAVDAPLLAGETVHEDQGGKCASMNAIIAHLPDVIPTAHVVSSSGCEAQADSVHFSSRGVRELGRRYAEKMMSIQGL